VEHSTEIARHEAAEERYAQATFEEAVWDKFFGTNFWDELGAFGGGKGRAYLGSQPLKTPFIPPPFFWFESNRAYQTQAQASR